MLLKRANEMRVKANEIHREAEEKKMALVVKFLNEVVAKEVEEAAAKGFYGVELGVPVTIDMDRVAEVLECDFDYTVTNTHHRELRIEW